MSLVPTWSLCYKIHDILFLYFLNSSSLFLSLSLSATSSFFLPFYRYTNILSKTRNCIRIISERKKYSRDDLKKMLTDRLRIRDETRSSCCVHRCDWTMYVRRGHCQLDNYLPHIGTVLCAEYITLRYWKSSCPTFSHFLFYFTFIFSFSLIYIFLFTLYFLYDLI